MNKDLLSFVMLYFTMHALVIQGEIQRKDRVPLAFASAARYNEEKRKWGA